MKYSILIIDDSDEDRYLLKRYLKKTGLDMNIAEASNGEEALDFLINYQRYEEKYPDMQPPLLAFLDINMPIMGGWEFLDAFREQENAVKITPTIVVMYSTSDQDEEKARIDGYDFVKSYIVKGSYSPQDLKEKVEECIRNA